MDSKQSLHIIQLQGELGLLITYCSNILLGRNVKELSVEEKALLNLMYAKSYINVEKNSDGDYIVVEY